MAKAPFNRKSVDPQTANRLGHELLAEVGKQEPDLARMTQLIADGADTEVMNEKFETPLMRAVNGARSNDAAELLLDMGADPNKAGPSGVTPYIMAVLRKNDSLVSKFIDVKADPNSHFYSGMNAMQWAAHFGAVNIATEIATRGGGDLDIKSKSDTPMDAVEYAMREKEFLGERLEVIRKNQREEKRKAAERERIALEKAAAEAARAILKAAIREGMLNHGDLQAPPRAAFRKKTPVIVPSK